MPLPRPYLLCFFCLFILWLCLTYIFMSPFQSEIKGMGKKAGASIEMSQESGNLTQCKQVMASRDAVCNASARRCEVRALHTVDAAAACHRHYSTSCVVLCSAAPHCVCVCMCTFKTIPQEKSPLPAFPQTGRTLSSPPPPLPLTLSVSSHPVINSKQKLQKKKKKKEIEQSIWLRPWWTQQEQLVLLKL